MSTTNKRHGLVLNQFNALNTTNSARNPILGDSNAANTMPLSSSSRSSVNENRKSLALSLNKGKISLSTAPVPLDAFINTPTADESSLLASSASVTDLTITNNVNVYADKRQSYSSDKSNRSSMSADDFQKYRQDTLSKLREIKNNSIANKENMRSESLNKLSSNSINVEKRTPLTSRSSSNLSTSFRDSISLKHSSISTITTNNGNKSTNSKRLSMNSVSSTLSTKSNKSTSSSFHKMAQRIARSVSGGSSEHGGDNSNEISNTTPNSKSKSMRSSSSNRHNRLSGGSPEVVQGFSSADLKAKSPLTTKVKSKPSFNHLHNLFNPPTSKDIEEEEEEEEEEERDHEQQHQHQYQQQQRDICRLKAKPAATPIYHQRNDSRYSTLDSKTAASLSSRLKHSISLRSLSSRNGNSVDTNDNESIISTSNQSTISTSTASGKMNLFRKSFMSLGNSSRNSMIFSNNGVNSSSVNNSQIATNATHRSTPSISLPIPQQSTRSKLNSKLKNSSSLLSISSFVSNNGDVTSISNIPVQEFESIHLRLLLNLCRQSRIVSFSTFMNKLKSNGRSLSLLDNHTDNYNSSSKLFLEKQTTSGFALGVWKVIPFGNSNYNQLNIQEAIQEVSIGLTMCSVPGFIRIKSSTIVKGIFPNELKSLYLEESKKEGNKIKDHNSFIHNLDLLGSYPVDQQYLILRLENGGESLDDFKVENWSQAFDIFWQLAEILNNGESKYEFEHRDLNLKNILIMKNPTVDNLNNVNIKIIDFKLSRAKVQNNIMSTSLDNPGFFKGKGHYQFEIYQMLRNEIINLTSSTGDYTSGNELRRSSSFMSINSNFMGEESSYTGKSFDWSIDCPKGNVLWLHYILYNLINCKGLHKISKPNLNSDENKDEYLKYEMMQYMSKCLDPKRKRSTTKGIHTRFKKLTMGDLKPVYFYNDFANVQEVLNWGKECDII